MQSCSSLFPIPYSLFPIPDAQFPIHNALFPIPYSLFPIQTDNESGPRSEKQKEFFENE